MLENVQREAANNPSEDAQDLRAVLANTNTTN